jgi:hypothetical protein
MRGLFLCKAFSVDTRHALCLQFCVVEIYVTERYWGGLGPSPVFCLVSRDSIHLSQDMVSTLVQDNISQ